MPHADLFALRVSSKDIESAWYRRGKTACRAHDGVCFFCTRPKGHEGAHIAAGFTMLAAIWDEPRKESK